MNTFIVKHKDQQVGIYQAIDAEHALESHLNSLSENFEDDGHYEVEPKPYEGPWCVCLFLVDRAYGGPEEGGWWFTYGEPVIEKGLPLPSWHELEGDADSALVAMQDKCKELNKGRRDISSVLSEGIYQAVLCEGQPQRFPQHRPHYE